MSVIIDGSAGVTTNTGAVYNGIQSSTYVASTSGTSIEFANIPSWVKRITIMFQGVSTNGTAAIQVQLGTGATPTYTITGYSSIVGTITTASSASSALFTTGFGSANNISAATTFQGSVILTNLTSNTWAEQGTIFSRNDSAGSSAGSIALGAALTAIRVIASATGNPADSFDAGSINILYE
jgi:hypothetical protein